MKTIRRSTAKAIGALALAATGSLAAAHDYRAGPLAIGHPYALATPPGATTGGAYLATVANEGKAPDALVGASSPAADRVEIHFASMDGDVMRMRPVASLALDPGKPVAMAPGGGYHLMLIGLHAPLAVGQDVPLTLRFEHAGAIDVVLHVQQRGAPMSH